VKDGELGNDVPESVVEFNQDSHDGKTGILFSVRMVPGVPPECGRRLGANAETSAV
jgi:hypothetical protein